MLGFKRRAARGGAARPAESAATRSDVSEPCDLDADERLESLRRKIRAACSWDDEAGEFVLAVCNQQVGRVDKVAVWVVLENVAAMQTIRDFKVEIGSIEGGGCCVRTYRAARGEDFGPEPAGYATVVYAE